MRRRKSLEIKHNDCVHTIIGHAPEGSLAEYLLLKRRYLKRDPSWMVKHFKKGKQLLFNTEFIEETQEREGELHCELCGKPELCLYYWWEVSSTKKMATADHFFPKSFDLENLAYNKDNLIVACSKCNGNKGDKFFDISTVKFPYKGTIEKLTRISETNEKIKEYVRP